MKIVSTTWNKMYKSAWTESKYTEQRSMIIHYIYRYLNILVSSPCHLRLVTRWSYFLARVAPNYRDLELGSPSSPVETLFVGSTKTLCRRLQSCLNVDFLFFPFDSPRREEFLRYLGKEKLFRPPRTFPKLSQERSTKEVSLIP